MSKSESPLSFKNILSGIIVTVVGGIILAYILQNANLTPKQPEYISQPTEAGRNINLVTVATPTTASYCSSAPQKRLKVGDRAVVCTKSDPVYLRDDPFHTAGYSHKLVSGADLVIVGEAVCDESVSWWYWKVRTESGFEGWIAEGGDSTDAYFLCPAR
jgi:hypothetical protein